MLWSIGLKNKSIVVGFFLVVFKKRFRKFPIISKATRISGLVINCGVWEFVNIKFLLMIKFKSILSCFSHNLLPILFLNIWPILVSLNRELCFFVLRLCWQFWQPLSTLSQHNLSWTYYFHVLSLYNSSELWRSKEAAVVKRALYWGHQEI